MPQFALLLTTFVWGATFPATKAALEQAMRGHVLAQAELVGTYRKQLG